MLAVLLAALGPVLALAGGRAPSASWVEVCSAQGSRWVAAADAAAPDQPGGIGHPLQHCPWCALPHQAMAVPPSGTALQVAAPFTAALPRAFLRAPRTLHAWAPAQARAPPTGAATAVS